MQCQCVSHPSITWRNDGEFGREIGGYLFDPAILVDPQQKYSAVHYGRRRISRRMSDLEVLQHSGDQIRDWRALGPCERHVREQRMSLERLDHRRDAVVATNPQVVTLSHIVGE